jgi:hypothetical protein
MSCALCVTNDASRPLSLSAVKRTGRNSETRAWISLPIVPIAPPTVAVTTYSEHMSDELGDLVEDPDVEHVPEPLRRAEGERVKVEGVDRETGERVIVEGTLCFWAGDFGDVARRRAEDDSSA